MFFKLFFVFIFLNLTLYSRDIDLGWLKNKPKTYARDFYIWQYLKQNNISSKHAKEAFNLVHVKNKKILFAYSSHKNNDKVNKKILCLKKSSSTLVKSSAFCIKEALSFNKASRLSFEELKTVIFKTKKQYPEYSRKIALLNNKNFKKISSSLKAKDFVWLFLKVSSSFRINKLNLAYSKHFIDEIKYQTGFSRFLKLIVTNNLMNKAQKSLLNIKSSKLSSADNFFLAMNALSFNKRKKAMAFLNLAAKKTKSSSKLSKILFWKYMASNDREYIKELLKIRKINLYTLFAHDYYKEKIKNVVYSLKTLNTSATSFDEEDQFAWIKVLRDTKKMNKTKLLKYQKTFSSSKHLAHYAYVKNRYENYKKSYFINPYKNIIKDFPLKRQNLINAIARQESRFIPSSISTAYAMGVMQIMPFLSKALAKQKKEEYDIFTMFNAKKSITYAHKHLNYLERVFKNPLLIAYAYNGGGGFTRSMFRKGLFVKNGQYEPYLSMEKVPYLETREYAKKVLSNYIVYASKDKKRITVSSMLRNVSKDARKSITK